MYKPYDIYVSFREAQSFAKNRPYRIPKNFEDHLVNKMSQVNRDALLRATDYFNTKWKNINPDKFMEYGFGLWKTFSYNMFFNEKLIKYYIQKDRNRKLQIKNSKEELIKSIKFIKKYMREHNIQTLRSYCMGEEEGTRLFLKHYVKENKIDKLLVAWFIKEGFIILSEDESAVIPYVTGNYRDLCEVLDEMNGFLDKLREEV